MARKAVTTDHYRLQGTFDRLRKHILEQPDDGRLEKQLSYWVLPDDRRLPIAFLDTPLRDLLDRPLTELLATPGVGKKKILGFFDLLKRAAKATPLDQPFGLPSQKKRPAKSATKSGFDPSIVSEALWETWCESVRRHGFADQKLGRLVPSLQSLPTVIWQTPLSEYVDRTLDQIRQMRTHGEKRVHAILEVFCLIHEAVATSARSEYVELELKPWFIPPIHRWIMDTLSSDKALATGEVRRRYVTPMLKQAEIDLGPQVAKLARERLQLDESAPSVKQQANKLRVTRARVYQLLGDCGKAFEVRWPEGRWMVAPLQAKAASHGSHKSLALLQAANELFYPATEAFQQAELVTEEIEEEEAVS